MLGEEGYAVDQCSKGSEAISQIRCSSYDFVLLDWMLPDIDGLTVCREIRSGGVVTPIIMLTARCEVGERVLGLRAGADDYLGKPFEIEELLARIHALLRRSTLLGNFDLRRTRDQPVGPSSGARRPQARPYQPRVCTASAPCLQRRPSRPPNRSAFQGMGNQFRFPAPTSSKCM